MGYQPVRAQAEWGAATYVGYFSTREKKGGALISWATCDWLLGDGDMRGLVGEAFNVWKDKWTIISTSNMNCCFCFVKFNQQRLSKV